MDTNVGDMPIEIFGDYVSDTLDQEWTWEYLVPMLDSYGTSHRVTYGGGIARNGRLGIDVRLYCDYSDYLGAIGYGYRMGRRNHGEGCTNGDRFGVGNGNN